MIFRAFKLSWQSRYFIIDIPAFWEYINLSTQLHNALNFFFWRPYTWRSIFPIYFRGTLTVIFLTLTTACGGPEKAIEESLRAHILFFANFEKGVDALDSLGDPLATFDTANTNHIKQGGNPDGYLAFNPNAGALDYSGKK